MLLLVLPAASHGLGLASGFGIRPGTSPAREPMLGRCRTSIPAIEPPGAAASLQWSLAPLRPPLHACRAYSAAATWCRACDFDNK
ncbi:uncharacterized protein TrAFT101_004995 [Trichoderma asperellum]|uniref:uncharacterized protein n=1 Tax=Trichoderma asperellum TaxID=101201 RepID=UPI003323FDFC|nr:hypothetical protein TrAFT101_004995 [Trichoderma asperellum]